ncbi:uncharacterized protein LOC144134829 [Amblyomma americanum]
MQHSTLYLIIMAVSMAVDTMAENQWGSGLNTSTRMKKLNLGSQFQSPLDWFRQRAGQDGEYLSYGDFLDLMRSLFTDLGDVTTNETQTEAALAFSSFDTDDNKGLDASEFNRMWTSWIEVILSPKFALLVVDVQNDFITGSLSVKNLTDNRDPERIVPVINELAENLPWEVIVYTQDWHPTNHISFFENKDRRLFHSSSPVSAEESKVFDTVAFADNETSSGSIVQTLWPAHCVQDTWGAQLHQALRVPDHALLVRKGTDPDVDSYSAFWDNDSRNATILEAELKARNITHVVICGIAYDVCVASTALHAIQLGFATLIADDASCGTSSVATIAAKASLATKHCIFPESSVVMQVVRGVMRPLELGLQLAKTQRAKNN